MVWPGSDTVSDRICHSAESEDLWFESSWGLVIFQCPSLVTRQKKTRLSLWDQPVKLNKHEIPHFKNSWVIHVNKIGSITSTNTIKMNFSAWSTWSSLAHLPKVVLHSKWEHSVSWEAVK